MSGKERKATEKTATRRLLEEADALGQDRWNMFPLGVYFDVTQAWLEYRRGEYAAAVESVTPALFLLRHPDTAVSPYEEAPKGEQYAAH